MVQFTRSQRRIILASGIVIYAVVAGAVVGWLFLHAQETTQRRLEDAPVMTVYLPGHEPAAAQEAAVPSSWQAETAQAEVSQQEADQQEPVKEESKDTEAVQTSEAVEQSAEAVEQVVADVKEDAPSSEVVTEEAVAEDVVSGDAEPEQAASSALVARWQKYARPFDRADNRPRIAVVITDLGLSEDVTKQAINDLPEAVSLAFASSANRLENWINTARADGHETILSIPMEPNDYPYNDPGPNTLLTGLDDAENVKRLRRAMAMADGYIAVMPAMGQKFVTREQKLLPVLDVVHDEGVIVFDTTMNEKSLIAPLARLGRIPFTRSTMVIDPMDSHTSVQERLNAIETMAKERGQVVVIAPPYPVTIEALKKWFAGLDKKGFALAPLTATISESVVGSAQ